MKNIATTTLQKVLDGLMTRYKERVPDVGAVINDDQWESDQ